MSFKTQLKWGWKRDHHDSRDFLFKTLITPSQVAQSSDLRNVCPVVVDQGPLGSCVGNAVAGTLEIQQIKQGKVYYDPTKKGHDVNEFIFAPSRLFIYYGAREMEGSVESDDGCQIRDAIKFVATNGVCTSAKWPYHVQKFADKPTADCYAEAQARGKVLAYHRLNNAHLHDLLACLTGGNPFVCGIQVYDSFMSDAVAATGIVPMPKRSESLQGGHAIVIVGHDSNRKLFIGRNSWSTAWGDNGYFYIPFAYLTDLDLANDFWTITQVE